MSSNYPNTNYKKYKTNPSRPPLAKTTNLQQPSNDANDDAPGYEIPLSATNSSVSASTSASRHSPSSSFSLSMTNASNFNSNSNQQFHRRAKSAIPSLPKPSHKPPSTSNDFRGDVKSQDIFAAALKKQNEKIRVLFPGMDRFEMERMDMVSLNYSTTYCS